MDRLFFALRPDPAAAARMHALALRMGEVYGLKGAPLPVERLHVTLCFLDDYARLPPEMVAAADAAASGMRDTTFDLAFDRVMSFQRKNGDPPLVLCRDDDCAPLMRLQQGLVAAVARTGLFSPAIQGFKPHVTLRYDRKMVSLQEVAPVSWTVTEVLLIRSLVGRGQHEVLGSYPLHLGE